MVCHVSLVVGEYLSSHVYAAKWPLRYPLRASLGTCEAVKAVTRAKSVVLVNS